MNHRPQAHRLLVTQPPTTAGYTVVSGTVVHSSKYGLEVTGANAIVTILSNGIFNDAKADALA